MRGPLIALALALAASGCDARRTQEERRAEAPKARAETVVAAVPAVVAERARPLPEYRLRLDPATHTVDARIELDLPEPGTVHLLFRSEWEGYPGLGSRLRRVEAWGASGTLKVEAPGGALGPGHRRVRIQRPGHLTIAYELVLTPDGDPRHYHLVSQLGEGGGHLLGNDLLPRLWPGAPRSGPQPALVSFTGLPRGWRALSAAPRSGNAYNVDDVARAVFLVGPLRTWRLDIGPRALTVAVYGGWDVDERAVVDAVHRIAGSLHRIAGDGWAAGDYVLGAGRAPGRPPGLSSGGQVIGRSAIVYVAGTRADETALTAWTRTMAHELMHWYIPTAFRFDGDPPSWFAEGLTDYMALKALLVGGLIGPSEFRREIGARYARYRASPLYGRRSVVEAAADFWQDDSYRYIYDGGAVAAFLLDLGFRDRRRSLERALEEARRSELLTVERLTAALAAVRENEWIEGWLATGANPDWEARFARYGLAWESDSLVSLNDWVTDALSSIRP